MHIYADNAATTRMSESAVAAMLPYMSDVYGNPSSLHSVGQVANEALQNARERIAACWAVPRAKSPSRQVAAKPTIRQS